MAEHFKELLEMPMNHLIEQVLPFRSPGYLECFSEKLLEQGIVSPRDLLGTTMAALEMKLSTHGHLISLKWQIPSLSEMQFTQIRSHHLKRDSSAPGLQEIVDSRMIAAGKNQVGGTKFAKAALYVNAHHPSRYYGRRWNRIA